MRVRSGGRWSLWAEPEPWSRVVKESLTITQPVGEVWEPTPPFDADMVGLDEIQWLVDLAATGKTVGAVYDSGRLSTSTASTSPTAGTTRPPKRSPSRSITSGCAATRSYDLTGRLLGAPAMEKISSAP